MKRILVFLLFVLVLLPLAACSRGEPESGKLQIVASAFPEYDFVRAVAGDRATLTLLLRPGTEAHSYEPTPQDILALQGCDLFVYGGGESDVWAERMISAGDLSGLQTLAFMDHALLRAEETLDYMTVAEAEEEEDVYDEHVWTSPKNAMTIVEAIRDALCAIDPAGAEEYRENAEAELGKLAELDARLRALAAGAKRDLLVFGDRFPFLYLTREYGLRYAAAFPGCSGETDANPATVARLIDEVKAEGIPVVFKCDLSAGALAETIAEATGAKVLTLYSAHTVSRADFEAGETYLTLMERNLNALEEALN